MDLGFDGVIFRLLIAVGIIGLALAFSQGKGLYFPWLLVALSGVVCLLLRAIK
jgi:hypothetical protein